MTSEHPRFNWVAAMLLGLGVLPFGLLAAIALNETCFHREGSTPHAVSISPAGEWCDTVASSSIYWPALIALPALLTAGLILLAGRHRWAYPNAFVIGAGLTIWFAQHTTSLDGGSP